MASAVEIEEGLESDLLFGGRSRGEFLSGSVVGVYVGLVVFVVMELHYFGGDGRFEGIVVIFAEGLGQQCSSGFGKFPGFEGARAVTKGIVLLAAYRAGRVM